MNKIYYVIIKGRTLESRDLRELLGRAVLEKRNQDRKSRLQSRLPGQVPLGDASHAYGSAAQVASL